MTFPHLEVGTASLFHGDCREVLKMLGPVDRVVTDPVWPNAPEGLFPVSDPQSLLASVLEVTEAKTVIICLGGNSDPRFLSAVPSRWPFIRSMTMPYTFPGYNGRLLGADEMAYIFGEIPKGNSLIPGRLSWEAQPKTERANGHPCPRSLKHTIELLKWWTLPGETVLDPFMGSGTTGHACIRTGRRFIGIELSHDYFLIAKRRLQTAWTQEDAELFREP